MAPPRGVTVYRHFGRATYIWEVEEHDRDPIVLATWMRCEDAMKNKAMSYARRRILYQSCNDYI